MEAVIIPAKTIVHVNGVPVQLAVDTIVETVRGNMALLTGFHYASMPEVAQTDGPTWRVEPTGAPEWNPFHHPKTPGQP